MCYFKSNVGLVVSTCLGGAFIGSMFSGWIADGVGRRRAFQLCALPMIIGASIRYMLICLCPSFVHIFMFTGPSQYLSMFSLYICKLMELLHFSFKKTKFCLVINFYKKIEARGFYQLYLYICRNHWVSFSFKRAGLVCFFVTFLSFKFNAW